MNPFLWDGYGPSEPNEKIRYWVDAWETMIDPPSGLNLGLEMLNAHLLVRSVRDEVVFNNFKNPDNRTFLKKRLEEFAQDDPATRQLFGADIALIRREFGGTRCAYIEELCRSVDEAYKSPKYLETLFSELRDVFNRPGWPDGDTELIIRISQYMIVELALIGFNLETIKELPASIFDRTTRRYSINLPVLATPEEELTSDGEFDYAAFQAAADAFANRGVSKRLDQFRLYFTPKAEDVILIYQLDGLKGEGVDFSIGHVNIYSPRTKRYIKSIPGIDQQYLDAELFGMADGLSFANAAVRLSEIDTEAATASAVADIEKALDLLRAFLASESKLSVRTDQYIRVSPCGQYSGGGERSSRSDDTARHFRSADLTGALSNQTVPRAVGEFAKIAFTDQPSDRSSQRIAYSLHWHRKAVEAITAEDRLLAYWIALESLVRSENSSDGALAQGSKETSKAVLIQELASALHACLFVANAALNLYRYLDRLMLRRTNGRVHFTLPCEHASKFKLGSVSEKSIDLTAFVHSLNEVAKNVDRKTVKDAVVYVHRLHTDAGFALGEVERVTQAAKDDLLLIYRFRNWIMHKAYHDNKFIPHYVEKARDYCGNTLRQVLHDLTAGRAATVEGSLMRYYVKVARMKEQLKNGKLVDFLDQNY